MHYSPHILHCCGSSLPSLSVTLCLLPVSMKPLPLKAHYALIGRLEQCVVIGQALQVCLGNAPPLSITGSLTHY